MSAPAAETSGAGRRIPELDGLRGLAILLVLLWHFFAGAADASLPWGAWLRQGLNLTWTGVDLFFVLSGFLIGGIMLDRQQAENFFAVFYARRALRILPIYYLILLGFLLATVLGVPAKVPLLQNVFEPAHPWWTYALFLQNYWMPETGVWGPVWLGMTWSLAVEEQFYLVLPFLLLLVPRKWLPWALGLGILAAPVIRILAWQWHPLGAVAAYVWMPARADALFLGVLGAWLVRCSAWQRLAPVRARWLYLALAWLAVGVVILHQTAEVFSFVMIVPGYTWMGMFYLVLLLTAVGADGGPVPRLARVRGLRWLGKVSYAAYLFHPTVNAFMFAGMLRKAPELRDWRDFGVTLGALAATLLLAGLSGRYFERPLLERGHTLRYKEAKQSRADMLVNQS